MQSKQDTEGNSMREAAALERKATETSWGQRKLSEIQVQRKKKMKAREKEKGKMKKKVNKKNQTKIHTKNMKWQPCDDSAGQKEMWLSNYIPTWLHIVPSAQSPQMTIEWTIPLYTYPGQYTNTLNTQLAADGKGQEQMWWTHTIRQMETNVQRHHLYQYSG